MWLSQYASTFFSSPIATLFASIVLFLLLAHLLIPAVLQAGISMYNFWDRGENPLRNAYVEWFKIPNGKDYREYDGRKYHLKQVKDFAQSDLGSSLRLSSHGDFWVWCCGVRILNSKGNDYDLYVYPRNTHATKEEAMRVVVESDNMYGTTTGLLVAALVGGTCVAAALDWLFFSYFLQTLIAIILVGGVALVMFGGRFIFDLNKKVDKVSKAETKEE